MTEVLPGIHQFRLPLANSRLRSVNGHLIKSDDGYVLVDCGWDTDDTLEALKSELRALKLDLGDIRTLVVTHYHSDHYGMAGTLVRLAKLRLLMHRLDWLHVRTHLADPRLAIKISSDWFGRHGLIDPELTLDPGITASFQQFTVVAPHLELEDEARIQVGSHELQVVWTPGHTAGHICLYDAGRRILLSGDHVLDPISPNVSFAWPRKDNPLGDFLASLRKVNELDADLVLPAHGEPFTGLQRRVSELLEHHDQREAAALDAVRAGPVLAIDVARKLPWTRRNSAYNDLPTFQQRLALAETIAHLEELRATGKVVALAHADRILYRLAADGDDTSSEHWMPLS